MDATTTTTTTLEFLLVSSNYETLTAVRNGLKECGASLRFVPTTDHARDYVARRKIDGIFVDLEVPDARELIQSVRAGGFNRGAVIFACLHSGKGSPSTIVPGADFLLHKPLTAERVMSSTISARKMMTGERRRFFRHPVNMPVTLTVQGTVQQARMIDLGEGGMALHAEKPLEPSSIIDFFFELPSRQPVSGKGTIVWANSEGKAGIKFQFLGDRSKDHLQKWLCDRQQVNSQHPASGDSCR